MAPFLCAIANNLSIANLCCAEDVNEGLWNHDQDDDGDEEEEQEKKREVEKVRDCLHPSVLFLEFPVEDEETISLLMRKEAHCVTEVEYSGRYRSLGLNAEACQSAIRWMLKVQEYYNFAPLTIILSVNFMDRFMSCQHLPVQDKVEHIFEAHMIQRMELLVLSTLDW
ncbi:unnamed protein product [Sphagnum balticum]